MEFLVAPLGYLMKFCYDVFGDYIIAITAFTIITKLILLPVAVWVHKNSIKMIELTPAINRIKAKYFGDGERIAEKQSALFKKVRYNPFASVIPLIIQIALLVGVIEVIYNPLTYLFAMPEDAILALSQQTSLLTGLDINIPSMEIAIINTVQNADFYASFTSLNVPEIEGILNQLNTVNTNLLVFDFSVVPVDALGLSLLVPLIAGFSSWLLCFVQNKSNVLQSEQSMFTKYFTMVISVGISVFLGLFVPAGVAYYWVIGNIFAILQLFVLNFVIPPKKYVNYEELEESRKELAVINSLGRKNKKWYQKDEHAQREKADYKRFFSIANKKLVFYSEKSGFYKYYESIITQLLKMSNITIHYVTSDPNDQIFDISKNEPRIKPYYIGEKKLITLFMKMDASVVAMTMPDLQNFHYKRSLVKKDVKYVFIPHWLTGPSMVVRKGALEHFDSVLCVGPHWVDEIRKSEEVYNTAKKDLIECGYSLLEDLTEVYLSSEKKKNDKPQILIAPSWQSDNIMESCIDSLLDTLVCDKYSIIVRPHPEFCKRFPQKTEAFENKYRDKFNENFVFQTNFSSNSTVFESDIVITDWSNIAYEFSLSTKKASIFINTEMKVMNPEYKKILEKPTDLVFRDLVGKSFNIDEVSSINTAIDDMINHPDKYSDMIDNLLNEHIYNFGNCSKISAKYILSLLTK